MKKENQPLGMLQGYNLPYKTQARFFFHRFEKKQNNKKQVIRSKHFFQGETQALSADRCGFPLTMPTVQTVGAAELWNSKSNIICAIFSARLQLIKTMKSYTNFADFKNHL